MRSPTALAAVRRVPVLATALAAAAAAAAASHGGVDTLVLALAVIPLGLVGHLLAALQVLAHVGVVLHVDEDVLRAVVRCHEAEALVGEELLDDTSGRHALETAKRRGG